ncbi:MAG: helix-turn-helix domain-containing protein, partial [Opitutaceae bacterium]|nr:helix-turn-helix domain-containing protein [Opitutaceae bacterium]
MQSIGERLEEARKRRGISVREASEATKIRGDFLLSFENNQFDVGLPEIYVRGFLRNYGSFLKIDSEKLATDYNATLIGDARPQRKEPRELFGRM